MPADAKEIFLVVVDDSPELPAALAYAAHMARRTGGRVGFLRIIAPEGFQHWGAIADRVAGEQRAEAERELWEAAGSPLLEGAGDPALYVREGKPTDAVRALLDEDPAIAALVLAGGVKSSDSGPLVSYFTGRGLEHLRVPVVVIPGHLDTAMSGESVHSA